MYAMDMSRVPAHLAAWRHLPKPGFVRLWQRLASEKIRLFDHGAVASDLLMPDIGQQTNPAGKSGKILKMPGHDPAREVGRQAIGTPGMALAPCLDRHGKLRQQVGREDEVDARIVPECRQRIHASARLPGEPCCDTGQ